MPISSIQRAYLDAMGIAVWRERAAVDTPADAVAQPAAGPSRGAGPQPDAMGDPIAAAAPGAVDTLGWDELEARVSGCTACGLCEGRTRTVFGRGSRQADWMIVGEGPGAEEDRQGQPFVGRAGQLLDRMVRAVGFDRDAVYVANIVKCRPPGNRDPKAAETAACTGYLMRQIELVRPRLVLAVGRVAAQHLLSSSEPLGKLRGRIHRLGDAPGVALAVTYHPAYLLRSPSAKSKSWEDLKMALDATGETPS